VHSFLATSILVLSFANSVYATTNCSAVATGSIEYERAVSVVRRTTEFYTWSKTHSFPVAFSTFADRQVLVRGKCYWSVSVYVDRPERFEMWHVFFVDRLNKHILIQDPASGEPISLQVWRGRILSQPRADKL
jgi:hypothetical protein